MAVGWWQIGLHLFVVFALARPLGSYMARVYDGERVWLRRLLGTLERRIHRASGIQPDAGMTWAGYARALLLLNAAAFTVLSGLQRAQGVLPLDPRAFEDVPPDLAFDTAVSFVTNTNWQAYAGEAVMSHLTQMLGLGVQNVLSAATGMAVLVALVRGLRNRAVGDLGNFWVDLARGVPYILLPLSLVLAALGLA